MLLNHIVFLDSNNNSIHSMPISVQFHPLNWTNQEKPNTSECLRVHHKLVVQFWSLEEKVKWIPQIALTILQYFRDTKYRISNFHKIIYAPPPLNRILLLEGQNYMGVFLRVHVETFLSIISIPFSKLLFIGKTNWKSLLFVHLIWIWNLALLLELDNLAQEY